MSKVPLYGPHGYPSERSGWGGGGHMYACMEAGIKVDHFLQGPEGNQ